MARRNWLVVLAAAIGTAACGGSDSSGPQTKTVIYTFTGAAVQVDSVKYDNGTGTLVKVVAPGSSWTQVLSVTSGSVEAYAYCQAAGGLTAKLKVTWTISGSSSQGDSVSTTTSAPGAFTLHVPHHAI